MRAGPLDRRIVLQRFTATQSPSGQPIETWTAFGGERWAMRLPVVGAERYGTEQLAAKEQVEFRIRWVDAIADLQPADRLIEPASDASMSPIPTRSLYDIIAVHEIGRREGLRVITARRADVTP
jgi:SPP1 family predicted phage head-tail adaptor